MPDILSRILHLIHNRQDPLLNQPRIKLRTPPDRLQDGLQIIHPAKQILRLHRLHNHQPVRRPQRAHPAIHIAPRMARERSVLQRPARGALRSRKPHQRSLQTQHRVRDPLLPRAVQPALRRRE